MLIQHLTITQVTGIDDKSCDGPSSETFKHALDAAILTILCDNSHFIVFILLSINMHILYLCILNVYSILQSCHVNVSLALALFHS